MTHFFLHGGSVGVASEKNKHFLQKLCAYGTKILIFPFGLDRKEEYYTACREWFIKENPEKKLSITCAHRDTQELIQQIQDHDILFFSGGQPYKHFEVINKIENFKERIQDKIIAGTSGGAIMWAKAYYSSNAEHCGQGNGFLPIKIIAHRGSTRHQGLPWETRKQLLDDYEDKLPIYTLPEQEYIEFTL